MSDEQYKENALGHMVPVSKIKEIDLLRDELVERVITRGLELQQQMAEFKSWAMSELSDFVDLSAAEYGVKYGGKKGNVSLGSFDGRCQIIRSVAEHKFFDERIQAAKELLDACIAKWSVGSNDNIKALVEHAFRTNKQGHIDVNQVLGLRQLNIQDAEWKEAMEALADSIQISGTSNYLRLYQKNGQGRLVQISLDLAKL